MKAGLWSALAWGLAAVSGMEGESATVAVPSEVHTNRLAAEKSPYLLQHAHNPVDWYPWGQEAFEKARRENKLIFLSVGYSTCHWCHVMERESFENPAIAKILNREFVCIKVDREERPDVDQVYMAFLQASTGGGGWPMNVWLTPELKPVFGGTYFPAEAKDNLPGFPSVLREIAEAWRKDRDKLAQQGTVALKLLRENKGGAAGAPAAMEPGLLNGGYEEFAASFDARDGGFGRSPKFPRPAGLKFLFRIAAREGSGSAIGKRSKEMALGTLRKMAAGGIHDQLGGGFHRYAVDRSWRVPHFEKMLYDQAQLAVLYLEAYQITGEPEYAGWARDILAYVRRDLANPAGGFYSAEDADSPAGGGEGSASEGAFYVWTEEEMESVLGKEAAAVFGYRYGVKPGGNVAAEYDSRDELRGKNILGVQRDIEEVARHFKLSKEAAERLMEEGRSKLLAARGKRVRPQRDEKILAAWNGLMISALARAAAVLEDRSYLQSAAGAAAFIREHLSVPGSGELLRSYFRGANAVRGFVEDYADMTAGLLDLYEASFDTQWLAWALKLQEKQDELFWDPSAGGYFSMGNRDPSILVRTKEDYDGAEPSPNSVSALNLLRLAEFTGDQRWREEAVKTLRGFSGRLKADPSTLPEMLAAVDFYLSKPKQIVLAGKLESPETAGMLRAVHRRFLPNKILMLADGGAGQEYLGKKLEFIRAVTMLHGKTTAYVCENYACQLPTDDVKTLEGLLDGARR